MFPCLHGAKCQADRSHQGGHLNANDTDFKCMLMYVPLFAWCQADRSHQGGHQNAIDTDLQNGK